MLARQPILKSGVTRVWFRSSLGVVPQVKDTKQVQVASVKFKPKKSLGVYVFRSLVATDYFYCVCIFEYLVLKELLHRVLQTRLPDGQEKRSYTENS